MTLQYSKLGTRRLFGLLALCVVATSTTANEALDACREARNQSPAQAVALCRTALNAAPDADVAFEARMHLATLLTAQGDAEGASAELTRAEDNLERVRDPLAAQRLARRQGMLAFQRGDTAKALSQFLKGLAAAQTVNDPRAIAHSENDLGVVYRRLGEDREALTQWLSSLENKRRSGETDLAATEDNIGNLYRDLHEPELAATYLQRALAGHEKNGRIVLAAHTTEDIGLLAADTGDLNAARKKLDAAWTVFVSSQARIDQLRLARHRAELEWRAQAPEAAALWVERALDLAQQLNKSAPQDMILLQARGLDQRGFTAQAYALMQSIDVARESNLPLRQEWFEVMSQMAQRLNLDTEALTHSQAAHRAQVELLQQRHGERMDALRVRFEFTELEHERDQLQQDNAAQALVLQKRRIQLLGLGLLSVVLIAALLGYFQRRHFRLKLRHERLQSLQRQQIDEARRVADSLRADLRSLRMALDQSTEPLLVVDVSGRIRLANSAAAQLLQQNEAALNGAQLKDIFGTEAATALQTALESVSGDDHPQPLVPVSVRLNELQSLHVRALSLSLEEELGVLALSTQTDASQWVETLNEAHARWEQAGTELDGQTSGIDEQRACIVALMQSCLEAWERSTCTTRLELAEKSGIWRITIDDGRLRTRTLNRYLDPATLPTQPRWREVLRTAYFVLAECPLDVAQRNEINQRILDLKSRMQPSTSARTDR